MAARQIYDPEGFRNIETDGRITGYQFRFKAQYYRGITLSIIRDIQINIDGESAKKEDIRFTVNGETFTMEETSASKVTRPSYSWLTIFQPAISLVSLGNKPFDGSVILPLTTLSALVTSCWESFASTDPQPADSATMESAAVIGSSRPVVMPLYGCCSLIAVLSITR